MTTSRSSGFVCRKCTQQQYFPVRPQRSMRLASTVNYQPSRALSTTPARRLSTEAREDGTREQAYQLNFPSITNPPYRVYSSSDPPRTSRERRELRSRRASWEEVPFQCFQEARKIIQADKLEKLKQIDLERKRLTNARKAAKLPASERPDKIETRIKSIEQYIERLKVLADINDPAVKRAFEDGKGTMDKPVYRHLARRAWELKALPILNQRLTQMHVVPDLLPALKPTVGAELYWDSQLVNPGEFVKSITSVEAPTIRIRSFDRASKLVSIVITDPDIPNIEHDGFDEEVLYFATNLKIDAFTDRISLGQLGVNGSVLIPWKPPVVQKGSPYHRLCVIILEHQHGHVDRRKALAKLSGRSLQSDASADESTEGLAEDQRKSLTFKKCREVASYRPIGGHLFRAEWDEGTEEVMKSIGSELLNTELRRERFFSPAKARTIERRRQILKR